MNPKTAAQINSPQVGIAEVQNALHDAEITQVEIYRQITELTKQRDELKAQLDAAQKACAEMRRQVGAIKHAVENSQPIPWMSMCERMAHALSSDCGKDYVPRAELEAARKSEDSTRRELVAHREKAQGNYWGWQGDSEDYLESLSCPVLISAASLRDDFAPRAELDKLKEQVKTLTDALTGITEYWPLLSDSAVDAAKECHNRASEALAKSLGYEPNPPSE